VLISTRTFPRRPVTVEAVGSALLTAAGGAGHRRVAETAQRRQCGAGCAEHGSGLQGFYSAGRAVSVRRSWAAWMRAGARVIDLDPATTAPLKRWRQVQDSERSTWGDAYVATGYVFTAENGEPVHADHAMQRFERPVAAAKVPGIRFHDLRHTHATLLLKAGVPVHVVTQRLGHSSAAFTLSRYSHVLPRQQSAAAAAFAQLVDRSGRGQPPGDVPPASCPGCGHDGVEWAAEIHGGSAVLADDGAWFAVDFDSAATTADLELTCYECGWSKTIAAGEWEAR
jgi:hypothetical protein